MNEVVVVTEDGEVYGPFESNEAAVNFADGEYGIYVGYTVEPMNPATMVVTDRG